jgi:hypothetical protein
MKTNICQENFLCLSFKLQKWTLFSGFKLEKWTHSFNGFVVIFKNPPSALWECGKTVGFSKSSWKVGESPLLALGWKVNSQWMGRLIDPDKTFPCFPQ